MYSLKKASMVCKLLQNYISCLNGNTAHNRRVVANVIHVMNWKQTIAATQQ